MPCLIQSDNLKLLATKNRLTSWPTVHTLLNKKPAKCCKLLIFFSWQLNTNRLLSWHERLTVVLTDQLTPSWKDRFLADDQKPTSVHWTTSSAFNNWLSYMLLSSTLSWTCLLTEDLITTVCNVQRIIDTPLRFNFVILAIMEWQIGITFLAHSGTWAYTSFQMIGNDMQFVLRIPKTQRRLLNDPRNL